MGNDEPVSAGKRVLGRELERHQKKLNGPKNTAKLIEAKQNWINRESKLAEMQENLRVRKETLSVAYEEIKILREDLLRTIGRIDGQKQESHPRPRRARRKYDISNNKN